MHHIILDSSGGVKELAILWEQLAIGNQQNRRNEPFRHRKSILSQNQHSAFSAGPFAMVDRAVLRLSVPWGKKVWLSADI
jgi:hypothetical protein